MTITLRAGLGLFSMMLVAGETQAPSISAAADALLASRYAPKGPGAAVLVVKDGKPLYRKGFGMGSVELQAPAKPEHVFRIGSVTKQFTAAAIMLLVEEGKIDLQAPVLRFFDWAPKTWEGVTVEMLLNHTSGIPSYTSDPRFSSQFRVDFTPQKLMEMFVTGKPLEFKPGADHRYNNSGYYLLGMLIEKVTGQTWDAFMKARFFEPLGMKHTRLGTETDLIPGLVSGYTTDSNPAPYMSMTQPGAAGALVSTVDDLATWTVALHAGKVVKPESLKRMLTPTRTSDGVVHSYGYGLGFRTFGDRTLVGHGGGINGFISYLEADPASNTVAVFLNATDSPKGRDDYYSRRLLGLAAGRPVVEPKAVPVADSDLQRVAGRYRGIDRVRTFVVENGKLQLQGPTGAKVELIAVSPLQFQVKASDTAFRFVVEGNQVKGLYRMDSDDQLGALHPKVVGDEGPKAVAVDPVAFDRCAGDFELQPGFVLRFWREGTQIFTQATGQPKIELFAENATTYFLKVVEAKVVFEVGPDGTVSTATLHQGGQALPLRRVK